MDSFLDCVIHLMGATSKTGDNGANNAAAVMRTLNATYLGGGNFSEVFALPWGNDRRVIKITGNCRDDGAMVVCRTAMKLKAEGVVDPLMPDIFAMHEFGKGFFMVEMERLSVSAGGCWKNPIIRNLNGCYDKRVPTRETVLNSPFLRALACAMADYVDDLDNADVNLEWDLHGDNVMMRRGQPVITDPIAYFRLSPGERTIDTGRKQRIEMGFPAKRDDAEKDRIVMPDFMVKPDWRPGRLPDFAEMDMAAMRQFMSKPSRMVDHVKPLRHEEMVPFFPPKWRGGVLAVLDGPCMDEGRKLPKGANDRPVNKHDAKPPRAHDHLLNQNDRRIANGRGR